MYLPLLICAAFSTFTNASPPKTNQPPTTASPTAAATICPRIDSVQSHTGFPIPMGASSLPISVMTASGTLLNPNGPSGTTIAKYEQPTQCAAGPDTTLSVIVSYELPKTGTKVWSQSWSAHSEDASNTWDYTCIRTESGGPYKCVSTSISGTMTSTVGFLGEESRELATVYMVSDQTPSPQPKPSPTSDGSATQETNTLAKTSSSRTSSSKTSETPGAAAAAAAQTADMRIAGVAVGAAAMLVGALGL